MTLNIESMSVDDLENLQATVEKKIEQKKAEDEAKALEDIMAIATTMGWSKNELIEKLGNVKKAKASSTPKYQHPDDSSKTWTGRGRKPQWVTGLENDGLELKDLLIEAES